MDAFYYIDKPTGITSFQVLREMRKILGVKKFGHSGTLDPLATGGLLVAVGAYTKLIPYVEKDSKRYHATIMLDGSSPSFDSDTEISFLSGEKQKYFQNSLSLQDIEILFQRHFFGNISQVPPKYSALKIDGKRALDRTLAGEEIEMKTREVEIFSYKIESFHYPELRVELNVSAGTYIRSIAHDLGALLGTGGYLSALRRTGVGQLDVSSLVGLNELDETKILDIAKIFGDRMYEYKDETLYKRLSEGQRVRGDFSFPEQQDIFLTDGQGIRFVVEYKNGVIHPRKKIL